MSASFILGLDPGLNGAIGVVSTEGGLLEVIDMPTVEVKVGKSTKRRISPELLVHELRPWAMAKAAYVEAVAASPQMGVSSAFAFGEALGILKGALAALQIPAVMVPPANWKRDLKINASKDGSRAKAIALWPDMAGEFRRVKDADRAEAALLAEWGRLFG